MLKIYHGSTDIIKNPSYGVGKINNDYGRGFYCTEDKNLAAEWACKNVSQNSYVNEYDLDLTDLKVLNLQSCEYNILHWMALLLKNRIFDITNQISEQGKAFILNKYAIDTSAYDVVVGYRADDSYFSFAEDFLNNTIGIGQLEGAMKLGKLGLQQVLVSEKAFANLKYINSHNINTRVFNKLFLDRDAKARDDYKNSKASIANFAEQVFLADIIRKGGYNG
ncbi:MAG: DUF3990 domain-containing protein [Bacillota bacterium]